MPKRRRWSSELTQLADEIAARRAKPCSRWKPSTASARSAAMPSSAKRRRTASELNSLALEMDRAAARRRTNEERCAELDARSAGAQAEIANTEEQLRALAARTGRPIARRWSRPAADVASAQQELQQRQQEAARRRIADRSGAQAGAAARARFWKRCQRLRRCATASRRRRSASPRSIARRSAWTRRLHRGQSATGSLRRTARTARPGIRDRLATSRHALRAQIGDARQQLESKRAAETEAKTPARFHARGIRRR